MIPVATIVSQKGFSTQIGYDFETPISEYIQAGRMDTLITSCEDGFSPLGMVSEFISDDLGIPEKEISRLANRNRRCPDVSLTALSPRRKGGLLKGVILAAGETSSCYEQFATPFYGRPYRDFYYNVTYEAIAYACTTWKSRHIGITHLSASGKFHPDIASCTAEALAHFCDIADSPAIDSFAFVGCCISPTDLEDIRRLNQEGDTTRHKPISTNVETHKDHDRIFLTWQAQARSGRKQCG